MAIAEDQCAPDKNHTVERSTSERERSRLFLMINSFETGGSERQFALLAKSLGAERFSVSLGCIQSKGALRDLFDEVPRFRLGGSVYGWKSWHSRWQLAQHLKQKRIQIAHAFDFYTNLTLLPAARWSGVPVVIGSQRQLGDLLSRAQSKLQRAAFRLCDAIVCNSRAAVDRLAADGVEDNKLRIIGNALAPELFAAAPPLIPRASGTLRFGMIARMNARYKNHSEFLRAAAKLCALRADVEFLLAGDGPLRPELQAEAASLGIADRVRFLGDQRDVGAVLASLDATVIPSDSESLSNVILESMAAGVPIAATRVGGNPELINDTRGILVPSRDIDALANAMLQLAQNPARRQELAGNARHFVAERFSCDSISRQYEELYDELLSRKLGHTRPVHGFVGGRKRLRVAIVAPSLRYVGGQSAQADLLLRQWKDDPEVRATFIPVDPPFPLGLRWAMRLPAVRTLVRTPFYVASLWRGLRDADVAHIFSASYSSFLIAPVPAWLVARALGRKVLINYHSGEARDHLRKSRIARAVLRRVDRLATPSDYLVGVFKEFGLQAQPVPNAVDVSQFNYRERKPLRPHLVCTRGFHRYYCIDHVVEAFAQVQRVFPDARLDLLGGGSLEPEIQRLVKELKLANVNFCGVVGRDEIHKYYDRADIFINASRLDNLPISLLEAFASGTPVVSTSPEGMHYVVEHGRTGLLSKVGDPNELAENVLLILRNQERGRTLAANAYAELHRYKWESVRRGWLQLYRDLVPQSIRSGE
jgi:glycosyltransferase involved in cell wall biosynthesis